MVKMKQIEKETIKQLSFFDSNKKNEPATELMKKVAVATGDKKE